MLSLLTQERNSYTQLVIEPPLLLVLEDQSRNLLTDLSLPVCLFDVLLCHADVPVASVKVLP